MNSTLPTGLLAVFAFLDEALSAEVREAFTKTEVNREQLHETGYKTETAFARDTRFLISRTFQLISPAGNLGEMLHEHRLFSITDCAVALTWAYSLHRRGGDPLDALRADYAFSWRAVLRALADSDKEMARDQFIWSSTPYSSCEGDLWAEYRRPTERGYLILRGDRLVASVPCLYMHIFGRPTCWEHEWDSYQKAGGIKAFVNGTLYQPPKPPPFQGFGD